MPIPNPSLNQYRPVEQLLINIQTCHGVSRAMQLVAVHTRWPHNWVWLQHPCPLTVSFLVSWSRLNRVGNTWNFSIPGIMMTPTSRFIGPSKCRVLMELVCTRHFPVLCLFLCSGINFLEYVGHVTFCVVFVGILPSWLGLCLLKILECSYICSCQRW